MGYLLSGVAILLTYWIGLIIYRLYLSPLAHLPGPRIAAATSWYHTYHDLVRGGQYVFVIDEMHRKHGPIVRIRPDTIHVSDPRFVDKLYTQSPKKRRERFYTVLQLLQAPGSILATKDHDAHRQRRAVLNPYFSQQNVRRLEPMINEVLANLLRRYEGWATEGKPVHMNSVFQAATKDIIQAYALGEGQKLLDKEDCDAAFFDVMTPQRVSYLGTHFYWLALILVRMPPTIMIRLIPRIAVFIHFMEDLTARIEAIRTAKEHPEGRTIFHEIMRSKDLPASEKETRRLADEAMVILIAGSDTTASTLRAIMYHLLSDQDMLDRLKAELKTAMPDNQNSIPSAAKLDNLPYLNAIIQEAIRLYPGATHRQDRCAPDEDLVYVNHATGQQYVVPAGTGIGMTAPITNRDRSIYGPTADEFIPQRYLDDPKLRKYQFSFSKGTRQCIGMNLAYQELQTLTAGIFHKYDLYNGTKENQSGPTLELYKTERRDIAMYAEYMTPAAYPGSQGLRVMIRH